MFGFVRTRIAYDLAYAFLVLLVTYVAFDMLRAAVRNLSDGALQLDGPAVTPPGGPIGWLLLIFASCTNGFTEELVFRGYLIPRFERLLGSTARSVICTSVLFALLHVYQGPAGTLFTLLFGVLTAVVFVRFRRIWPVVYAHAAADVLPFLPTGWLFA
jgi:membrane protease YdiL (CAAX protease family)